MAKFYATIYYTYSETYEVTAESEDQAHDLLLEMTSEQLEEIFICSTDSDFTDVIIEPAADWKL